LHKKRLGQESGIILEGMAETLTGKGEMLVKLPGYPDLVRCQGSFIDDENMEAIVKWWSENCPGVVQVSEPKSKPKIVFDLSDSGNTDCAEQVDSDDEKTSARITAELTLRRSICEGVLNNADDVRIQIPTIRDLAAELGISTRQVSYIIDQLKSEDWVVQEGKTSDAKVMVILSKEMSKDWLQNNFQ
jgi:DNA segregation ATPase FtsK/SpoIIIE-like protein